MSAFDLISLVTDAVFLLVFVMAVVGSLRDRRRSSVEAALFFGAIAWILLGERSRDFGVRSELLTDISLALLMASPYLLLRQVHHLVGVSERVMRAALVGLMASVLAVFVLPSQIPLAALTGLVAYFGGVMVYAAVMLMKGTTRTAGVARHRARAAVLGSILLALAIVALGFEQVFPVFDGVTRALVLGSGLAYFAAFATPAFLKRAWVEPELRTFVARLSELSPLDDVATIASEIEAEISRATGGTATIAPGADPEAELRVGRSRIAVPLSARGRRHGTLVVDFRTEPLFPDDDRALVALFADQAALMIDGARLYSETSAVNRQLAEATRAKSEFLASMSHELRTPMNAILGFSDLLVEQLGERLAPVQLRYFDNIKDAGSHLLQLINEVLDMSRVEAGRLELRPAVTALDAVLEPVLASTRAAAAERGLEFEVNVAAAYDVRVDTGRLRQILYNLLSNATKFTEPGGSVTLAAEREGRDLRLEVSDTGVGIPPELQSRVFGTFERLHESTSGPAGTGLGLALTKRLVELHGGSISFESVPGRGTTFRVRLPGVLVDAMTGRRLLVVDDEQRDAELIAALATAAGLRSEIVPSAAGAQSAVRRDPPIAVVLDLRLPDGRGEQVLEDLKARPTTRSIPVIVVTVEDDEGSSQRLGAEGHLTKPIDRARLGAWLEEIAAREGDAA